MIEQEPEFVGLVGDVLDEFAPSFARHQLLVNSEFCKRIKTLDAVVHERGPEVRGKCEFVTLQSFTSVEFFIESHIPHDVVEPVSSH